MAIDPNVVFKIDQPEFVANQRRAEQENLANQATQIANAQSLTQLETKRIELAKRQRQDEYDQWRATNSPEINPVTGTYDVNDYVSRAIKNGYGEFALRDANDLHTTQLANAKSQQDVVAGHETGFQTLSATLQQVPPNDRAQAADKMASAYEQKYGINPKAIYGDNWYDVINKRSQTTADNRNYNNAEGRDPASQTSKNLRNLINTQGGNIPDSVSAFEIVSNPAYKELYDAIGPEARVGALKEAQRTNVDINRIRNIVSTIDQAFKNGVKPAETIRKYIDMALNDEDRAQRKQIVSELKALGIDVSETDSIAGARDALTRRLNELEGQKAGAVGVARSRTISSATESQPEQPTNTSRQEPQPTSGNIRVRVKSTGEIILATPNQLKMVQDNPQHFEILDKPKTVKKTQAQQPVNIANPTSASRSPVTQSNSRPYLAGPDVVYGD
jgi:hypothetical protein